MSASASEKVFHFDWLKWMVVVALVVGGAIANSIFAADYALIVRVLALVGLGVVALLVAVNTAKGDSFWSLMKAAQVEVKKVVWPSRRETTQTTLIVVAVVLVAAIILWALDNLLGYLASLIIG